MRTKLLGLLLLSAFIGGAASAQTAAPPPMKTFASADEVQAAIAKAKATRKDGQADVSTAILQVAPYRVGLDYRPIPGIAEVHLTTDELIYVVEGSGVITMGGTLDNAAPENSPANLAGSGISGGKDQPLVKGDFVFVPVNTPHQYIKANELVVMTMHVPKP